MLSFLPPTITGIITILGISLNTIFWCILLYIITFFKLIIPLKGWQTAATKLLIWIAEAWISVNDFMFRLMHKRNWEIIGTEGLSYDEWYLVSSNHVSTADIFILQSVFNKRIPFLKFFIKQELIWVPLIGLAWWALDFPFMKRYPKTYLEKHPEKRGKDLETTRKKTEKFKYTPVSIINFLEGTRLTPQKYAQQHPPYDHLLYPKAGGVALVVNTMGDYVNKMLDITLVYPNQTDLSFWAFLCGRTTDVVIHITQRTIPPELWGG